MNPTSKDQVWDQLAALSTDPNRRLFDDRYARLKLDALKRLQGLGWSEIYFNPTGPEHWDGCGHVPQWWLDALRAGWRPRDMRIRKTDREELL